jgi:hypothetical protein
MFIKKDYTVFGVSIAVITFAYLLMAIDTEPNGFGAMTLWIAPPLLLAGFALPVAGIVGIGSIQSWVIHIKTTKHLMGFVIWTIAMITYTLTLEPTASLWDCSEFIAAAYKLQVPHTPGTPLSLLVGRVFAMMAREPGSVAFMLNFSSAFFSACCALLVYHITYYFASRVKKRIAVSNSTQNISSTLVAYKAGILTTAPEKEENDWTLIVASVLSSLTLVFSDTFWFSAVEAETYGIACFFLLVLVTLIIHGKDLTGERKNRWLVLVGYLGGLSYCIHPMCVLALALLPFYWYTKGDNLMAIRPLALLFSGLILVFLINRIVAIGLFEFAFGVDKFFVNSLSMPFYSGAIIFVLCIILGFVTLIRNRPQWRGATWATVFLILGFTPYIMLFIRSNHNPPIDETNPENLPMIKAYMNRESYPSSPLLYGPYFDASVEDVVAGRRVFHQAATRYEFSGTLSEYRYEKKRSTILPRLYSNDADHIEAYRQWLGLKPNERPTFSDNLNFLFTYQLGHMYLRYLMFNFAGRESDRQGADWLRPWDTTDQRASLYTSRARNQYWMLPLLAGVVGAFFQWHRDRKGFTAVLCLFLITGLVLALYLNSPPIEPRERDYIYVASFIAFCIWIGMSAIAIANVIRHRLATIVIISALGIGIPLMLLIQNYDDHDRSRRTFQADSARNLLASCAPNAILFTGGDNDTFPLWYLQEVEGFRTDVRVVVLSYFNTDWYIGQLRKPYYQSPAFNLTLSQHDYLQYGPNDVLYIQESIKEGVDAKRYLQLIKEGNKALRMQSSSGDYFTLLPSKKLLIRRGDTTTQAIPKLTGAAPASDSLRNSNLILTVKGNYATKSVLGIIDVMISNGWQRPVYFNYTSLHTAGLDLNSHVVQEGAVYRFDPLRASGDEVVSDPQKMYENLVVKADYSNLLDPKVHFNYEDYYLRIISPLRQSFNSLATTLLQAGNVEKAREVMQFAKAKVYLPHLNPTFANLEAAEIFVALNDEKSAVAVCTVVFDCHFAELKWQRENGRDLEPIDHYLAQQSARMLAALGNSSPEAELARLGI